MRKEIIRVEFCFQQLIMICLFSLIPSSLLSQVQDTGIIKPKKVIIDCDMCVGVDDVGALAMLHAMADQGEV